MKKTPTRGRTRVWRIISHVSEFHNLSMKVYYIKALVVFSVVVFSPCCFACHLLFVSQSMGSTGKEGSTLGAQTDAAIQLLT